MRSLSIQVQPNRAPGLDMAKVSHEFQALLLKDGLVKHHDFNSGEDKGLYFNFTLGLPTQQRFGHCFKKSFTGMMPSV